MYITASGNGTAVNLQFMQEKISIGPILPYDDYATAELEVHNPSHFDTELISLDFDLQYLEDEKLISKYSLI